MQYKVLAVIILSGILLLGWSNPLNENRDPNELYHIFCSGCHGMQQQDFRAKVWASSEPELYIADVIKNGDHENGMPSYSDAFSDEDIRSLSEYIFKVSKEPAIDEVAPSISSSEIIHSEELDFRIETVVDDLGVPWGLAFLPNNDLLISERSGKLSILKGQRDLVEIKNVPEVVARGQGGLMDILLHPQFEQNQLIYLSYSKKEPGGNKATTAVMRARLVNDRLIQAEDIFIALPYAGTRHHYGSRMRFDYDNYLFISVGDRGNRDVNPQSLSSDCGKIHRIHDDGSIPSDNPFINTPGARKTIYSYGHRNPQGLAFHPETGILWSNEHGPRGGDEMNIITKGKNYGWPVISYGINYSGTRFTDITHKEGMEQPEHYWDPSIGVCGLDFVGSWRYPQWAGDALAGSLRFEYLARLKMEKGKIIGEEKLLENMGRLRDVKFGNDGYLYVTVEDPGRVLRIMPVE